MFFKCTQAQFNTFKTAVTAATPTGDILLGGAIPNNPNRAWVQFPNVVCETAWTPVPPTSTTAGQLAVGVFKRTNFPGDQAPDVPLRAYVITQIQTLTGGTGGV